MLYAIVNTRAFNSAAILRFVIAGFIQSLLPPRGVIAVIPLHGGRSGERLLLRV